MLGRDHGEPNRTNRATSADKFVSESYKTGSQSLQMRLYLRSIKITKKNFFIVTNLSILQSSSWFQNHNGRDKKNPKNRREWWSLDKYKTTTRRYACAHAFLFSVFLGPRTMWAFLLLDITIMSCKHNHLLLTRELFQRQGHILAIQLHT
jgi:hypothetical protein